MTTSQMVRDIFFTCLLPLIGILCAYGIFFLRKRVREIQVEVDNETFTKYSDMLIDIIEACVITTNQTYVNALKEQGNFRKEEQEIAFQKTYDAVKNLITVEMGEVLSEVYKDLDFYIKQKIEETVNVIKFTRTASTIIA